MVRQYARVLYAAQAGCFAACSKRHPGRNLPLSLLRGTEFRLRGVKKTQESVPSFGFLRLIACNTASGTGTNIPTLTWTVSLQLTIALLGVSVSDSRS